MFLDRSWSPSFSSAFPFSPFHHYAVVAGLSADPYQHFYPFRCKSHHFFFIIIAISVIIFFSILIAIIIVSDSLVMLNLPSLFPFLSAFFSLHLSFYFIPCFFFHFRFHSLVLLRLKGHMCAFSEQPMHFPLSLPLSPQSDSLIFSISSLIFQFN